MRLHSLAFCSLLFAAPSLLAQAPPAQADTAASSRLVKLPVIIHDKKGKIVNGLTKEDFSLTQDGRQETIHALTPGSQVPLALTLAVDTSGPMREAFDTEKAASKTFFDAVLAQPQDEAALLHFDHEVELLEDLTASKSKLATSLSELGPTGASTAAGRDHPGRVQFYDALYLASHDLLADRKGRKVILMLGDGEDHDSKESLTDAIEAAQKAGAVVYTIYLKGSQARDDQGSSPRRSGSRGGGFGLPGGMGRYPGSYPGGGNPGGGGNGGQNRRQQSHTDGKKVMERIAVDTGGDYFEAKKKEDLGSIYKEVADELQQQSMLSFTPDAADGSGFHHVQLTAKKKDLFVQIPAGYYSQTPSPGQH